MTRLSLDGRWNYEIDGLLRLVMSLEQAADESAISRLYGGIHYRTAIENGKRMGRCIIERTPQNIVMLPRAQGE